MSDENETPLKRNRTKNGQSRKLRPRSTGYQFRKVAKETITVEVGGARLKVTLLEAYVRQLYTMTLNKNSSGAARLLNRIRKQFPGDPLPGDPITFLITEADANL
jgi:hypothetical protein